MKQTKLMMVLVCLTLVVVSDAMAFYSNHGGNIENMMLTKSSSVYIQELFDPADDWLPGETKQKEVKFGNMGARNQVIRFRIETQWLSGSGDEWTPTMTNPVEIKWSDALGTEWMSFPDDDGWYYYKDILMPGAETKAVMEAVKFATKLSNDRRIQDFTHTTYRILIYMEGLDADSQITNAKWSKTFTQNDGLDWKSDEE